jgi:hypothetical protein
MDVVPSSLPPSGLPPGETPLADLCRPPWVRTLDVPPPPSPLPIRPRLDFGRRVHGHAHPVESACSGLHLRSVLRFASGFFPTRPHGARHGVSRRHPLRAVASGSRLLPTRPAKDFHLQSSAHARHTHARLQEQAARGSAPAARCAALLTRPVPPWPSEGVDRGRDAHYCAPPAQIRTCGFPAYGSHLGCLTAKRL